MRKINVQKISDLLLNTGMLISILTLILIFISKINLPPNTCPIADYDILILISVFISSLGFILSFVKTNN